MSTIPTTPTRLQFDEPEVQFNARFAATPIDSPRFSFQNLVRSGSAGASSTPNRRTTPRTNTWGARAGAVSMSGGDSPTANRRMTPRTNTWGTRAGAVGMSGGASPTANRRMTPRTSWSARADIPSRGSPRMCMHGATCVKYGCTFAHPACRPVDCPEGENCLKVKCLLHHPRSRPIPQYKATPDCRYGIHCTKVACPFNHPVTHSPRPPPDASPALAYSGYQVGQVVEAQHTDDEEWKAATVRRIRGAKLTIQFAGSDDFVDVPRTRVRDPDDPDKEAAVMASDSFVCQEVMPPTTIVKVCMHGVACVKYGCTFAHPPGRPADCPDGENCTEVKCVLHHPRTRPLAQYKVPVVTLTTNPEPATPRPAVMSPELEDLHARKVAAIGREDYMEAQKIKLQMLQLVKLEKLARQKQAAVQNEDYLLAMELKRKLQEAQSEYDAEYDAETTT